MDDCKTMVTMTLAHDPELWACIASATRDNGDQAELIAQARMEAPIAEFDCAICAGKAFWERSVVELAAYL